MKTIKKVSLFFVLLFSTFFFQFCDRNPCGSGDDYKESIIESYFMNRIFKIDSNNVYTNLAADSIKMKSDDTVYLEFNSIIKQAYYGNSYDLFACSPVELAYLSAGDSLKVFTLDDFDNTHSAGSDVSEYFVIARDIYVNGQLTKEHKPLEYFSNVNTDFNFKVGLTVKPTFNDIRLQFKVYKKDIANAQKFETPSLRFY